MHICVYNRTYVLLYANFIYRRIYILNFIPMEHCITVYFYQSTIMNKSLQHSNACVFSFCITYRDDDGKMEWNIYINYI